MSSVSTADSEARRSLAPCFTPATAGLPRFTPRDTGYSLFLLVKRASRPDLADEPTEIVPCWRTPMPRPHALADHSINLVIHGRMRLRWTRNGETRERILGVGDMLALPGGVSHIVDVDDHLFLRGFWIASERFTGLPGATLLDLSDPPAPVFSRDPGIHQSLLELWEQTQAEYARPVIDPLAVETLRTIGRLVGIAFLRLLQTTQPSVSDTPADARVLAVRAWIDRNFTEPILLADLAERASLSVSRFSERFSALFGVSPKAYVMKRRLAHAAVLLAGNDLPILEVAALSGLPHLPHFSERFRQAYGLPPAAYRKEAQEHAKKG